MERTTKKCPLCDHIDWSDEDHVCPTPEYLAARDALIHAAIEEEEQCWLNATASDGTPTHLEL